jgi:hypothetical protein
MLTRRQRRASRSWLSTVLTSTKTDYGFTHLHILKTGNNQWVRPLSVETGVTVSAGITKVRVRTMAVYRAGSIECVHYAPSL